MNKITDAFSSAFERNYFKLFGKAKHGELNYRLFKTLLKCIGVNNWESSYISGEKWVINSLLKQYGLKNGGVFFDVGANVGNYAKELLAAYPVAKGYLFEPHPVTFEKLNNDCSLGSFKKFNIALGDTNDRLKFYDRSDSVEGSTHASIYREVIAGIHSQSPIEIEVEVKTLDSFCSENNITKIDFLKIDTEGHELAVLKGARNLITNSNIKIIQFEFNEMNVISRTYMRDFLNELSSYQLNRLLPDGLFPLNKCILDTELFGFQNIVAINDK